MGLGTHPAQARLGSCLHSLWALLNMEWPYSQGIQGRRADLVAFLGDVWADGHDLIVEDVVLFYLAVDQRQIGPKALATQRILQHMRYGVSGRRMGCSSQDLCGSSWPLEMDVELGWGRFWGYCWGTRRLSQAVQHHNKGDLGI